MKMNIAPARKPTAAGIHFIEGNNRSDISIEGANKLQKLAATITPPVKPSIVSNTPRCMVLKKNTKDAPAAVTNHVNNVASNALYTGPISIKNCVIDSTITLSKINFRQI